MKNILIVEDESLVALEIKTFISGLGDRVVKIVSDATSALEVVKNEDIDLILMDVYIKGDMDGITCASEIKKVKEIPVIYISAFSDDETLQRAIETDPTAYLIKPFNRKELLVAIQIATRSSRRKNDELRDEMIGDVMFDSEFSYVSDSCELIHSGVSIHLTKREKQLLKLLVNTKNGVVSIDTIEYEIWPDKNTNENTRRALVSRLRSKLNHKFLETIHSFGYRLNI